MPLPLLGRLLGTGALSVTEAAGARVGFGSRALLGGTVESTEQLPAIWGISPIARRLLTGEEGEETPPEMEEINLPVSSSAIRSIGYRGDDTITVEFIRGGTYTYEGSKELFLAFASAGSKGQFFNEHFK